MSTDLPQEEEENAAEGKFGQVFEKSQALTNAEVSVILQRMVVNKKNEDPAYQPNPLLVKTQEYVETFSTNKNEAVNEQVRSILENGGLSAFEVASVANLQPESAEEAKTLIPSLDANDGDGARFPDEELQQLLDEVATYKQA